MRFLLGIIIGAAVTVGAAYIHDSKVTGPLQAQERLVNWDLASAKARTAVDTVRAQIKEWTGV